MPGLAPGISPNCILHEIVGSSPTMMLVAAQSPHPFTFLSSRAYIDSVAG